MNAFIRKTLLFIGIFVLGLLACIEIMSYLYYKRVASQPLEFSIQTVFLGDSHIQLAINDTLLTQSKNLAQSSEPLYFSYYRLKTIITNNPSVKTVCLGFSYHSISSYYDEFIDGKYSNAVSTRYFLELPFMEQMKLLYANRSDIFSYIKVVFKVGALAILSDEKPLPEGFLNNFSDTKADEMFMERRIKNQYYTEGHLYDFSSRNMAYLQHIKTLCRQSNLRLVLMNTPLHPTYKNIVPQKFLEQYKQLITSLRIEELDLSQLLSDDSLFIPDGDHVSQTGAQRTTEYLGAQWGILKPAMR